MYSHSIVLILATVAPWAQTAITGEFNCTTNDGTGFKYAPSAVNCDNVEDDVYCNAVYPPASGAALPAPGTDVERPLKCFVAGTTAGPAEPPMVKAAVASCPKNCGYCCQTPEYNCQNVQFPRLTCSTITATQCRSMQWRVIIAQDCPSACGFCNEGGCVDAVLDCANDLSICNAVGMQDFVNQYCQKTCARCGSTTSAAAVTTGTGTGGACTTYIADSVSTCRAWAQNGFCTNNFYNAAQRRQYCATTCRIC